MLGELGWNTSLRPRNRGLGTEARSRVPSTVTPRVLTAALSPRRRSRARSGSSEPGLPVQSPASRDTPSMSSDSSSTRRTSMASAGNGGRKNREGGQKPVVFGTG
ncbi:hypothetical protein EYF80_050019 [Liparis tanakae]|uniref:Uncharacterized protein n=1 Tax=Liparis tanakae TaxID=230148 RepID=A0A4Z2FGD8_9TELE|nr:hypothetical protein EYF80_050019 [Liparis tanakae]